MTKQYRFNEAKCKELFTTQFAGCNKVTAHIDKDPEAVWNGIPIYHDGQWNEDNLTIVRNHVCKEPILVRYGAINSLQCNV